MRKWLYKRRIKEPRRPCMLKTPELPDRVLPTPPPSNSLQRVAPACLTRVRARRGRLAPRPSRVANRSARGAAVGHWGLVEAPQETSSTSSSLKRSLTLSSTGISRRRSPTAGRSADLSVSTSLPSRARIISCVTNWGKLSRLLTAGLPSAAEVARR